jgi:hypothetical protein
MFNNSMNHRIRSISSKVRRISHPLSSLLESALSLVMKCSLMMESMLVSDLLKSAEKLSFLPAMPSLNP